MIRLRWLGPFASFCLILCPSSSSADFELKVYLELRDKPQIRDNMRSYFTGVGRGIFWASAVLSARGLPPIFCMPKDLALDEGIIQSILDQEIRENAAKRHYQDDTPVELILVHAFTNKFPCPR